MPKFFLILIFAAVCILLICVSLNFLDSSQSETVEKISLSEKDNAIENALYTKADFFGQAAIVPFPTENARERLAQIAANYPKDAEIYLKLSELDEKLENYDAAESEIKKYAELQNGKLSALNQLTSFYERRGKYEQKAEILNKMLELASANERGEYFSNLINFSKTHKIEKYLNAAFYRQIIAEDDSAFSILELYLDKLIEEKNFEEALQFISESKAQFSDKKEYFISKEVSILLLENKIREAENVYIRDFDVSWSDELTNQYYSFLSENDRFRTYGNELINKYKANPANFDLAIRLVHFRKYDGDSAENVILQLENARAKEKIEWKAEELLTVSLFLISEGNADLASRFLYTLFLKEEAQNNGKLRAKILYQLFALLSDAENERLVVTKGDLNFYRDIAASDTNPGITTGIISLIFADENPERELENKEKYAVKLFNRAAAYRIFSEYKKEFPESAELAQMYLDIVRLYTAEKDFEIAQETLAEFEQRFADSANYPLIALKLADAYIVAGKPQKEREIYQKVLDYFGSKRTSKNLLVQNFGQTEINIFDLNKGINIPDKNEDKSKDEYYFYEPKKNYTDFISLKEPQITYEIVLNRYVASLSKEEKTQEIMALYNHEISKYSDEEQLYEDFLIWLGQTNFTGEQLEVYKRALNKFQNKTWRDKLARWYIKNRRKEEFGELSRELIGKFNSEETRDYLWNFVDQTVLANPLSFDGKLYYALYLKAHERFPHNRTFVNGLLNYYSANKQYDEWRKLLAKCYFEMPEIRQEFLTDLSKRGELRAYFFQAGEKLKNNNSIETLPYKLFRADASAYLSNFEESVAAYRKLNRLYPNTSEFSERLINFTRSLGQNDKKFLTESAAITHDQAEFLPVSFENRVRAGELQAELGDYENAKEEWRKLIETAKGEPRVFLDTATVFWDYFQYDDALKTIENLRSEVKNEKLYAFQTGAIYEAKHDTENAVAEYVRQLAANTKDDEVLLNISRTKKRLVQLSRQKNIQKLITNAFENERKNRAEHSTLILNYTHFLIKSKQNEEALNLLNKEVRNSNSEDFLLEAKLHYENLENKFGERLALEQLAKRAQTKRNAISYKLQLAEDFTESGERQNAAGILADLIEKHPTNYGVLSEADEFYQRLGMSENAVRTLQKGVNLGRGNFKYIFSRKLASRFISLERLPAAEQILLRLHDENKGDTDVFDELADIYVRGKRSDDLRKVAAETLKSLEEKNLESREPSNETADWRRRLINSYTRLQDYDSAVAQHIEIINKQPDDEQNVEDAIKYVRRYGGAEKLLEYYEKLADEAYKNYRWTLVLARIYEADKNFEKSIENYKLAIVNQPEMVELYDSLGNVYEKSGQIDEALKTIDKMLEMTHESPNFLKRKIEILEHAGRIDEAENVREKITGVKKSEQKTLQKEFAEAADLSEVENAKAIKIYRTAFDKLLENPLDSELQSADITGYVKTVRGEDSLNEITERLWNLREKLIFEIERTDTANLLKAKTLLSILDGAFPEAIGNVATQNATGNELDALYKNIESRIESNKNQSDKYQTFALLQNLIADCGFSQLNEKILTARKDETFELENFEQYHNQLRVLLNYYEEKGEFQKELEILESEFSQDKNRNSFEYHQKIADVSKILGNRAKELQALQNYFYARKNTESVNDEFVNRYLEMLLSGGENGRAELEKPAESQSQHQIQTINFFIAKNEKKLAHIAIENASFQKIWKSAKNAETALALSEFEDDKGDYFLAALQFATIGELVRQKPDENTKLIGDDWFRLTYKFGNWLKISSDANRKNLSEKYLPAMTENRPKDATEQFNLGSFYLAEKDFPQALEHFAIAYEMHGEDKNIWANLGTAYFQNGEIEKADEIWNKIIAGENHNLEDCELYFKTLHKYGQAGKAVEKLLPILTKFIDETDDENPSAALLMLLREISDSFLDENEKTEFWLKLSRHSSKKLCAAKYVVEKSLVEEKQLEKFYLILIEKSPGLDLWSSDYEYKQLLEMNRNEREAKAILDQEKNFEIEEPENERLRWQREYLDYLLEKRDFVEAKNLLAEIEKSLQKKYAPPFWLRIADLKIDLEKGISPETFRKIKEFIGITDVADAKQANPPNLERLNETIKLLKNKNYDREILDLRQAFYARSFALEKYKLSNFSGLTMVLFEKKENGSALKLLDLMIKISFEETRETAISQLLSLDLIKEFAPQNPELFEILEENDLNEESALELSAQISARFGHIDFTANFRRKLFVFAPKNSINKIELARLFSYGQNFNEAVKLLSSVISDRNASRNARWQALAVCGEIIGNNGNLWQLLKNDTADLKSKDAEMSKAIEALSLSKTGNYAAAMQIFLGENQEFQSSQLLFLKGSIAKEFNQNDASLKAFLEIKDQPVDFENTFGFVQEKPLFQTIRLYLIGGKPNAALKIAGENQELKTIVEEFQISDFKFPTLAERAEANSAKSRLEILKLLSETAENKGKLSQAVEFEKRRAEILSNKENVEESNERIAELERKIYEVNNQPKIDFRVDKNLVSK